MKNLNEYNQSIFEPAFTKTELYETLKKDFDYIRFSKLWDNYAPPTVREVFGTARQKSIFSAVPFYYLEFLTKENPKTIYDLGCGWNIFKKYIPNIVGIGAENPADKNYYADIHDYVDRCFVAGHQNYFDSVFSINALHFVPLSDLQKLVYDFHSMIAPNGTGWLALNAQRLIEQDPKFSDKDRNYLDEYIRKELFELDINYLVFDVDLSTIDEYMDGNIRLVMQKSI